MLTPFNSKDFSYKSFSYSQDNAAQIHTWPNPGSSNIFYKKVSKSDDTSYTAKLEQVAHIIYLIQKLRLYQFSIDSFLRV